MTKAEVSKLKKGSWLEDTSGIYEIAGISPDNLISLKEVIFLGDSCNEHFYGVSYYIMRSDVEKMELIAE